MITDVHECPSLSMFWDSIGKRHARYRRRISRVCLPETDRLSTRGYPGPFPSPGKDVPMKLDPSPSPHLVTPDAPSFASVIARLETHTSLSDTRRRDLISSVRRIGRILGPGRPLEDLPADAQWCRSRLSKITPAAVGLAPKTWSTLRSNLGAAFAAAGLSRSRPILLTGEWARLWAALRAAGDMQLVTGLSRFPRFCQQSGLAPAEVTNATLIAYGEALRTHELNRNPDLAVYYAARAWNLAIDRVPGWPSHRLAAPDRRRTYALPWSHFPPALETEVDAWLARGDDADLFADTPARPLAFATVRLRKGSIQRYASALVHAGVPADTLSSLAAIVEPDKAETGLRWLLHRGLDQDKGGLGNIATAILMAAKVAVGLEDGKIKRLSTFAKRLGVKQRGMTAKNRLRLEPFRDEAHIRALLTLPRILTTPEDRMHPERAASRFETGLAIALLTSCPIRLENLREIEIDKHLIRLGQGRRTRVVLQIPAAQVKNHVDLRFELPRVLVDMIDRFLSHHRPRLARVPNPYLFCKRSDNAPISASTIRRRIMEEIRKHLGSELTPHNFRHLAGMILLTRHPGQYETVRRLLGHRNGSTALDHYVGFENDAAHRVYNDILAIVQECPR